MVNSRRFGGGAAGRPDPVRRRRAGSQQAQDRNGAHRTDPVASSEPSVPDDPPAGTVVTDGSSVPVYGGTLGVSPDGLTVYAADPESARIVAVDAGASTTRTVDLAAGTRPFRVAVSDDAVFVTLRGASSLARIDRATDDVAILPSCAEPRGVEVDGDAVFVACASGELERRSLDGALEWSVRLDYDLRDVVEVGGVLLISRLTSAEVLTVDPASGALLDRRHPALSWSAGATPKSSAAQVAWRMVATPDGTGAMLLHQRHSDEPITLDDPLDPDDDAPPTDGVYGAAADDGDGPPCDLVHAALTFFPPVGDPVEGPGLAGGPLAVDLAWDAADGQWLVVRGMTNPQSGDHPLSLAPDPRSEPDAGACVDTERVAPGQGVTPMVAGAYGPGGLVVLTEHPFSLRVVDGDAPTLDEAPLPPPGSTAGFRAFHRSTPSGLTCASCHPEGASDGHVWNFGWDGLRRTLDLRGGLSETAPFHWDGTLSSFPDLMEDVMVGRMGAPESTVDDAAALASWLDGVSAQPAPAGDPDAIARGRDGFVRYGCPACHDGAHLDGPVNASVGTGYLLQPPSLIGVGSRGPWMHDGCATTLAQRFLDPACGGAEHGAPVPADEVPDLVAYLESL
jgi:hypothetical protein